MENIHLIFDNHVKNGLCPGAEWKIIHKNKTYKGKSGYLDLYNKNLIKNNSIYRIWSMTKPIISVVILQMIQEKKINLYDELSSFLPIFSNLKVLKDIKANIKDTLSIKKQPTIKDLLMHTAGFSYNFLGDPVGEEYDKVGLFNSEITTLEDEINLLSTIPLLYEPSSRWVYSVSVDILARIIEVVSNSSLQDELKKRIFDPLEMFNTGFSINSINNSNLMSSYHYDAMNNVLISPNTNPRKIANYGYPLNNKNYARGGIGLFSTLDDYSNFSRMLINGKSNKNQVILSQEMLKEATRNQLPESFLPFEIKNFDIDKLDENIFEPYGWGFGFRILLDIEKNNGIGSLGEFGWGGAASTYFLVDPRNDLTAVFMTQVFEGNSILHKDFISNIYMNI